VSPNRDYRALGRIGHIKYVLDLDLNSMRHANRITNFTKNQNKRSIRIELASWDVVELDTFSIDDGGESEPFTSLNVPDFAEDLDSKRLCLPLVCKTLITSSTCKFCLMKLVAGISMLL
jgi:hypothetical protein